jgi:hypothetical protein
VIKSKNIRWMGQVACMGKMRNAFKILVGKLDGKRTYGRLRRRREDIIKWISGK